MEVKVCSGCNASQEKDQKETVDFHSEKFQSIRILEGIQSTHLYQKK